MSADRDLAKWRVVFIAAVLIAIYAAIVGWWQLMALTAVVAVIAFGVLEFVRRRADHS